MKGMTRARTGDLPAVRERGNLERHFDARFATSLALREKQIQQSYRPIIGIHKWFARRPGTLFRNLLLSEFNGAEPLTESYWRAHELRGLIADPFMGGGTTVFEANRLGFDVVATDINPMAWWIVRQGVVALDLERFAAEAAAVASDVEADLGSLYGTTCLTCGKRAAVKYFLWVKRSACPSCHTENDLFPGYLLAEAVRHPRHVLACAECGALNEYQRVPHAKHPARCRSCGGRVADAGPVRRGKVKCRGCGSEYAYLNGERSEPLAHRLWAIEYHCATCAPSHAGRFFKAPDQADLDRVAQAEDRWASAPGEIPDDAIPPGDESDRLHRWGYRYYRQMFNDRQRYGLSRLLARIRKVPDAEVRNALLTVFSDSLRYQNMLCRYDTYALKCQDIFSVHGYPVGLVQCENNLLGIPRVGSGSFRHFVEKYLRAKRYAAQPFETRARETKTGTPGKEIVPIVGERIEADLVEQEPDGSGHRAQLAATPATCVRLAPNSVAGVFTDPPYFDNVQYAELMDFCYVWLRLALREQFPAFAPHSTRQQAELTGNVTEGRSLAHFTTGLSEVFVHYAAALKPGAPFVFTYHHNDAEAYVPLVVAILDAGMTCTATLPAAGEMSASLHIAGTGSSVLDSVFVCRAASGAEGDPRAIDVAVAADVAAMRDAGVRVSEGDLRCLVAGHVARLAIGDLWVGWRPDRALADRMAAARDRLHANALAANIAELARRLLPAEGKARVGQAAALRGKRLQQTRGR